MIKHVGRRKRVTLTQKGDSLPLVTIRVLTVNNRGEFVLEISKPDYMECRIERSPRISRIRRNTP